MIFGIISQNGAEFAVALLAAEMLVINCGNKMSEVCTLRQSEFGVL